MATDQLSTSVCSAVAKDKISQVCVGGVAPAFRKSVTKYWRAGVPCGGLLYQTKTNIA